MQLARWIFVFFIFSTGGHAQANDKTFWSKPAGSMSCKKRCMDEKASPVYGRDDRAICANYVKNNAVNPLDRPGYKRDKKKWNFCKVAIGNSVVRAAPFSCLCSR